MADKTKGEVVRGSWRTAFDYKYLSSEDIDIGKSIRLTITEVTKEMAYDRNTKEEKALVSVWFEETDRALALNATNAKAISAIAGTSQCHKWGGTPIGLTNSGETFFGKVGALRVCAAPESRPAAPVVEVPSAAESVA